MNEQLKTEFEIYARSRAPEEAVAVYLDLGDGKFEFRKLTNTHSDPTRFFRVSPLEWSQASKVGKPSILIHSHPTSNAIPTETDKVMCEELGIPWKIYSLPDNAWCDHAPNGYVPDLVGREYVFGVTDCYTLLRDYYRIKLGIDLGEYYREPEWWLGGLNLYLDNYEKGGFAFFKQLQLQEHDVILIQIRSKVPNHAAVYLGKNLILHHLGGKLSSIAPYGGMWVKHTYGILRHKTLL